MEKKPNPPGQHGVSRAFQMNTASDYKKQLLEKQRLKAQYNIHEKQMRIYFREAQKHPGQTADLLVQALETRLDAVVYRSGIAPTIYAARQYVNHGHFLVNGKKVNIPSYPLKPNDKVSVKPKSIRMEIFDENNIFDSGFEYLTVDKKGKSITLNYYPRRNEVPVICEVSKVIEFYSR
jgi:small subunit ribosomal protein S4